MQRPKSILKNDKLRGYKQTKSEIINGARIKRPIEQKRYHRKRLEN